MTEAALLAAILADPADDMPRLILADWWDENGQSERAEFCRVQCRLAEHPGMNCGVMYCSERDIGGLCASCSEFKALHRRERELLRPDGGIGGVESMWPRPEWSGGVVECFRPKGNGGYSYRRGFVHSITCTAADWLKHGDSFLAAQPVEEVTLTTWPNMLAWFPEGRLLNYHETTSAAFERMAKGRWGRIKKWTLPPQHDVGPLVEAAIALAEADEEDDPYGTCFCSAALDAEGRCTYRRNHTA